MKNPNCLNNPAHKCDGFDSVVITVFSLLDIILFDFLWACHYYIKGKMTGKIKA